MRRPERDRLERMLMRDPKLLLSLSLLTNDIVKSKRPAGRKADGKNEWNAS